MGSLVQRPFFSVIIPVYNVDKYLNECLDSLLTQDIHKNDYEIICIDDGSTDDSPGILDEYEKCHSNIKVVHQQNMGVSDARNVGINLAKGQYFWFVDPDDFVIYNVLSSVRKILTSDNPDVLWVKAFVIKDGANTKRIKEGKTPYESEIVKNRVNHWLPTWFFSRSLILDNQIRFYSGINIGDKLFCEMTKPFTKTKQEYDLNVYCYRIRENSISTTPTTKKLDKLIYTCGVYYMLWQDETIDYEAAMSTVFSLLINIMNCLAQMPRGETKPYFEKLYQYNLYPSKEAYRYFKKNKKKFGSRKLSITQKLRRVSYFRIGYHSLRACHSIHRLMKK